MVVRGYGKFVIVVLGESGETLEFLSIASPFFFSVLIFQYRIHFFCFAGLKVRSYHLVSERDNPAFINP